MNNNNIDINNNKEFISNLNNTLPNHHSSDQLSNHSLNQQPKQLPQLTKQKSIKQNTFLAPRQQSMYQKKVGYTQNYNFSGNKSTFIEDNINKTELSNKSLLVPNTFHHKSHPNAKSKELGSTFINDDHTNNTDNQHHHQINKTPNWMPEELNENWPQSLNIENQQPPTPQQQQSQQPQQIEPTTINTIVHNSDIQLHNELPWQQKSPAQKNLQHIFSESNEITDTSSPLTKPTSSPMKIFGGNYDTYTKQQLNGVLKNIASNKNTPAHITSKQPIQPIQPRAVIKDFTKTGSYNDKSYKNHANKVFSNLEKKFKSSDFRVVSASSTPRQEQVVESEYASYTTGYSSDEKSEVPNPKSNDYTMISKSEEEEEESSEIVIDKLRELTFEQDHGSSYTNESLTQEDIQNLSLADTTINIKWKSPSKLKKEFQSPIINGERQPNLKVPDNLGNMVFDSENQKWINYDENYTLDGLSELNDEAPPPPKKEVSFFQEPANITNARDVTNVHDIEEVTFSETEKSLVSVLNDILLEESIIDWEVVEEINIAKKHLIKLKMLDKFLPNLKKLDASHNHISYLSGIPRKIIGLNLSFNKIENRTTFKDFASLRYLNLANNQISRINLCSNIQLTSLNLSNNQLTNFEGLKQLKYLNELNLSGNLLEVLDLSSCEFFELQKLNVSNNNIKKVTGIGHLKKLRVLNCDYNNLLKFDAVGHLTNLSINQNQLKVLDVRGLKSLRCLKFDGNQVEQFLMNKINGIEKISCKFQPNEIFLNDCLYLRVLNVSGCTFLPRNDNITHLTMNSMKFKSLPNNFAEEFPNLQYLNLNFNHFTNVEPLFGLKKLYCLLLVSNDLTDVYEIMAHLKSLIDSLMVLDLRLNPLTKDLYSYVFFPEETPIQQLNNIEDLENLATTLQELSTSGEWQKRNEFMEITDYKVLLILYFQHLKKLDGLKIPAAAKIAAHEYADVLVLTTPANYYVDIRKYKTQQGSKFYQVFELCLAGKEIELSPTTIKFDSFINSQSLKESLDGKELIIDSDIGEFSQIGLDRKEVGKMKNSLGVVSPYIEIWRSLDPIKHSPSEEVREDSSVDPKIYYTYKLKSGLGMLVRLDNWKQGLIQLKDDLIVLRSWYNGSEWINLIEFGDITQFNLDDNWQCIEKNN
ncbi:NUD1 [Candida jiufengensis]|uniref:NUD1 n=1 Tax=Candida jiufengensis TaxID=497108 RepID=UPI0022257EC6|nr:NUD1 [Candida jiufengensis]KAI5952710.1 NUD1 [Candida jiufengensis]